MTDQLTFSFGQSAPQEATSEVAVQPRLLRGRKAKTFRVRTNTGVIIDVVADDVLRPYRDQYGHKHTKMQTAIRILTNESMNYRRREVVEEFWLGEHFDMYCFDKMVEWLSSESQKCVASLSTVEEAVEYIQNLISDFGDDEDDGEFTPTVNTSDALQAEDDDSYDPATEY